MHHDDLLAQAAVEGGPAIHYSPLSPVGIRVERRRPLWDTGAALNIASKHLRVMTLGGPTTSSSPALRQGGFLRQAGLRGGEAGQPKRKAIQRRPNAQTGLVKGDKTLQLSIREQNTPVMLRLKG